MGNITVVILPKTSTTARTKKELVQDQKRMTVDHSSYIAIYLCSLQTIVVESYHVVLRLCHQS